MWYRDDDSKLPKPSWGKRAIIRLQKCLRSILGIVTPEDRALICSNGNGMIEIIPNIDTNNIDMKFNEELLGMLLDFRNGMVENMIYALDDKLGLTEHIFDDVEAPQNVITAQLIAEGKINSCLQERQLHDNNIRVKMIQRIERKACEA